MQKVKCSKCDNENLNSAKYCSTCGYELIKKDIETIKEDTPPITAKKSEKKKQLMGTLIGVVFFFIAYYAVQHLFFKTGSIDNDMMNFASEFNKSCPITLDSETRLDNTVALPNKTLQYNYTLVNTEKKDVDTISVKEYLEPNIINNLKSSPQMQYQRDHKWALNYYYKDKHGVYLFLIIVTPEKYSNE